MTSEVLIIILSLFFSAFFSGMEIAFISSNKIHIEIEKKQGGFLSKLLSKITAKPSKFIATMLIGNNIALVVYGLYMGDLLGIWSGVKVVCTVRGHPMNRHSARLSDRSSETHAPLPTRRRDTVALVRG